MAASAISTQPNRSDPPRAVRFYGLLDHEHAEVIEFEPSRAAAKAELAEILADEPGWVEKLEIVMVDFSGAEPTVASAD